MYIKFLLLAKTEEPDGPQKELRGPPVGCGPPVEKHWSEAAFLNANPSDFYHNLQFFEHL
jgi:hypothetical protein